MSEAELVVEARLEDPGRQVPRPGDQTTIAVMRYAVERVVHGDYPHEVLYAGHGWADLSSPDFRPGVRHRLELTREFPPRASLLSTHDTRPMGVFFCVSYEVLGA